MSNGLIVNLAAAFIAGNVIATTISSVTSDDYKIDPETGICTMKTSDGSFTGGIYTPVRCSTAVLNQVDASDLVELERNGLSPVLNP